MIIERFTICNYRSLKKTTVPGLSVATVLHGPNNSGKSNVLHALQTIFAAKTSTEEVEVPGDVSAARPAARGTAFWLGQLTEFQDNFHMGSFDPIRFDIQIRLPADHVDKIQHADALESSASPGHDYRLHLVGTIARNRTNGMMDTELIEINRRTALRRSAGVTEFLPTSKAPADQRESFVRSLLDTLNDSVYVIPSSRYLARETSDKEVPRSLDSSRFKSWLHSQSLSRDGFAVFDTVRRWFNTPPFNYGEITFMQEGDRLEIMVDDGNGYRMPIESKGTGVQQVLVLLGYIAIRTPRVICVEEPELNLSFQNQDAIVSKLSSLVHDTDDPPYQLIITSHSDHIGSRSDLKQFHVGHEPNVGTTVRRFTVQDRRNLFPRFRRRTII
jgi:predicted ATP-dependent endonuclease of OLD family